MNDKLLMTSVFIGGVMIINIVGAIVLRPVRRCWSLMDAPMPVGYQQIIERNLAVWKYLPEKQRRLLAGRVNVFLSEKTFEACGGATVDEEVKVTVAAAACVLLLGRRNIWCYPSLRNILIYPESYVAPEPQVIGDHLVVEDDDDPLDGSCESGNIILGRRQVLDECRNVSGSNVVFHEFAHQLDVETGLGNGRFAALSSRKYMSCYQTFCRNVRRGDPDVLDEYGAEDPAEFFAVSTEAFFSIPAELRTQHPDLYQILKRYYHIDPVTWFLTV